MTEPNLLIERIKKMDDDYVYDENDESSIEREEIAQDLYDTLGEAEAGGYNDAIKDIVWLLQKEFYVGNGN